jgi:exopolyphosphatase/guanosine-5'-triphosphate,3'-diphosphate pyrophosphatase
VAKPQPPAGDPQPSAASPEPHEGDPGPWAGSEPPGAEAELELVTELLGRRPRGRFEVAVRDARGRPSVLRNDPFLHDGTPMPTLYWLVDPAARLAVDRLEASGGVKAAEAAVDPASLAAAHASYAAERDRLVPDDWVGPRPAGGVAGTRRGVKCLHAHYAFHLAGGADPVGRWVADRLAAPAGAGEDRGADLMGTERPVLAGAIDCGTNSTRMLIAYPGGEILESVNRITRLGQGVDSTRRLAPEAIERTMAALRDYKKLLEAHGVERVRMTATSAARDASNSEEFFSAAEAIVGVRPELLSGDEEGRLSFAGATSDLDPSSGPWLIVDIGGGSTELVVGPGPTGGPRAVRSLDVGCVRLTERFLHTDPPTRSELHSARDFVTELLERTIAELPEFGAGKSLVGLAGTVSCLSAIDQGIEEYDRAKLHHHWLTADAVEGMLESLSAVPLDQRRLRPGVEAARADVIVAGTVILSEIMGRFGFDRCLTSEADILDGLVLSTAAPL